MQKVTIHNYDSDDLSVFLTRGGFIRFELDEGTFDVGVKDGQLRVQEREGRPLLVEPVVANTALVSSRKL